jgi:hypothetical protein
MSCSLNAQESPQSTSARNSRAAIRISHFHNRSVNLIRVVNSKLLCLAQMSSSIPLAYLPIRPSGQARGSESAENRRSTRPTDVNEPSLSDNDNENDDENAQQSTIPANQDAQLKEGGYGWVVTGCKSPTFNGRGGKAD